MTAKIEAPSEILQWFNGLTPESRGQLLTELYQQRAKARAKAEREEQLSRMRAMRNNGASLRQIADFYGLERIQGVSKRIGSYRHSEENEKLRAILLSVLAEIDGQTFTSAKQRTETLNRRVIEIAYQNGEKRHREKLVDTIYRIRREIELE